MIFVILFKMVKNSNFHRSFFQIVGTWRDFTVVTKLMKNFKILYGFGGRFLKIRDVCMDFEPCFKVHDLVSVHLKSIILGQMTNLSMIFQVVVSVYRLVKIWNSPQSPVELEKDCTIGPWKFQRPRSLPLVSPRSLQGAVRWKTRWTRLLMQTTDFFSVIFLLSFADREQD